MFVVGAAVASTAIQSLPVTDASLMWAGAALALALLAAAGCMAVWPALSRAALVIPIMDFLAIGLLRFGTGDSRSVFLAIVILPVIWIAAGRERWRIAVPLLGVCLTLLLPLALAPGQGLTVSELVRLAIAVLVYAAAGAVVNQLSRQSLQRLTTAQLRRRLAEAEVSQAAAVQRSLQPVDGFGLPAGFVVAGACVPSRSVGGDFFDWYTTPDGGAAFTLGDVMGKGVGAGMIAAAVRSVMRSSTDHADPATAFHRASLGLTASPSDAADQFTTCFHARISPDGTMLWADAGHGLTILRRAAGGRAFLRSDHLPIGVGTRWTSDEVSLNPGDSIVSVSDGVLDLFGGTLESIDRYESFIDSRDSIEAIVNDLMDLALQRDREDDVTVMALTFRPSAS